VAIDDDGLQIIQEGRYAKFVERVEHITFAPASGSRHDQQVVYVTERAVFRLTAGGLELIEIAPGIDLERDVVEQMGFRPSIADPLATTDPRLLRRGPMGRIAHLDAARLS
jgi:propionate CoA-transferase